MRGGWKEEEGRGRERKYKLGKEVLSEELGLQELLQVEGPLLLGTF